MVRAQLAQAEQRQHDAILLALMYVGELSVNHARNLSTYKDQTGNLRASIGYVVAYNGTVVKSVFVGSGTGSTTGEELARTLAAVHSQGWALIVVAGMNYAVSVESKGLDVLTSAEQMAQRELPTLIKQLSSTR